MTVRELENRLGELKAEYGCKFVSDLTVKIYAEEHGAREAKQIIIEDDYGKSKLEQIDTRTAFLEIS